MKKINGECDVHVVTMAASSPGGTSSPPAPSRSLDSSAKDGGTEADEAAEPTYNFQLLHPPFAKDVANRIYTLLGHYGPQYHAHFGKDMIARLQCDGAEEGLEGIVCAVAVDGEGEVVAHACVIFDADQPEVTKRRHPHVPLFAPRTAPSVPVASLFVSLSVRARVCVCVCVVNGWH